MPDCKSPASCGVCHVCQLTTCNHRRPIVAHVEYRVAWRDGAANQVRRGTIRVTAPSRKQVLSRALYRVLKRWPAPFGEHEVSIVGTNER